MDYTACPCFDISDYPPVNLLILVVGVPLFGRQRKTPGCVPPPHPTSLPSGIPQSSEIGLPMAYMPLPPPHPNPGNTSVHWDTSANGLYITEILLWGMYQDQKHIQREHSTSSIDPLISSTPWKLADWIIVVISWSVCFILIQTVNSVSSSSVPIVREVINGVHIQLVLLILPCT